MSFRRKRRSIQDFKDNQTRFLVIGKFEPEIAKKNKSSFLIRTENKPGALLEILEPFNENNINLFRIETRPSRLDRGSHDFFIDSEGHIDEKEMQLVIKKIKDVSLKSGTFNYKYFSMVYIQVSVV